MFLTDPLTLCEVLDGLPHAAIERSSVGGALERQATLPVVHSPVMESGRGFSVDQILLQKALQDHLINTITIIRIEESDFWRLAHVDSSLTCLSLSRSPKMRKPFRPRSSRSAGTTLQTPTRLRPPPSWASQPPLDSSLVITTAFTRTM